MSDAQFSKFVPGFDFLQGLMKNAGSNLPGIGAIGQWVAPTLNPEELGKRIEELRTVQFWLEQNARMLAATIQALEVQRMTLSTLKTMNVPMAELKEALKVPDLSGVPGMPGVPPGAVSAVSAGKKVTKKVAGAALKGATKAAGKAASAAAGASGKGAAGMGVDPMQWWGALTQQFSQVAANAMKDSATDAAKGLAQSLVKQSIDAAGDTLRKAASVPPAVTGSMAKSLSSQRAEAEAAAAVPAPKAAPRKRVPAKRR